MPPMALTSPVAGTSQLIDIGPLLKKDLCSDKCVRFDPGLLGKDFLLTFE